MSPKIQHVGGTDDGHAVVFLHGVNGDGLATWTHRNGFCWPKALAAETGYTVYTVTYPAATNWGHAMPLQSRAHSLLDSLRSAEVLGDAELCLVGHSFGGIVAKQMVRHAADNSAAYGAFLEHLAGIAFVGTPHDGAGIATLGDLLRRELGSTVTLEDLRYASPLLLDLGQWFVNHQRANGPLCHALYETRPLRHRWLGPLRTIQPVSAASANPGLADTECVPVDADHSELAKPASSSSPQFRSVGRFLERAFEVPAKFARLPRQVAAVCYRLSEQGPEFLLVKAGRGHELDWHATRGGGISLRVTSPHGWVTYVGRLAVT